MDLEVFMDVDSLETLLARSRVQTQRLQEEIQHLTLKNERLQNRLSDGGVHGPTTSSGLFDFLGTSSMLTTAQHNLQGYPLPMDVARYLPPYNVDSTTLLPSTSGSLGYSPMSLLQPSTFPDSYLPLRITPSAFAAPTSSRSESLAARPAASDTLNTKDMGPDRRQDDHVPTSRVIRATPDRSTTVSKLDLALELIRQEDVGHQPSGAFRNSGGTSDYVQWNRSEAVVHQDSRSEASDLAASLHDVRHRSPAHRKASGPSGSSQRPGTRSRSAFGPATTYSHKKTSNTNKGTDGTRKQEARNTIPRKTSAPSSVSNAKAPTVSLHAARRPHLCLAWDTSFSSFLQDLSPSWPGPNFDLHPRSYDDPQLGPNNFKWVELSPPKMTGSSVPAVDAAALTRHLFDLWRRLRESNAP